MSRAKHRWAGPAGAAAYGHPPTCIGGNPASLPKNDLRPYQFGPNGGRDPANQGQGRPATAPQRHCMEAIERGDSIEKLLKRFPAGMVRRLQRLSEVANDPENRFWVQAQLLVHKILIAPKSHKPDDAQRPEGELIEVRTGRLEVPMPGAPGDAGPNAKVG